MMRPTSKISACLLVACVGLPFVFSNSVWPEEAKVANPRIKELQQKRLAVLEQVHDVAQQSFMHARTSFEDVYAAKAALQAARRAYADSKEARIKACDEAVQDAINLHEFLQRKVAAGGATQVAALKAEALVLETQLERLNAESAQ